MTEPTFDADGSPMPVPVAITIIQKQATPLPVTMAIGTGSDATRADVLIVWPCDPPVKLATAKVYRLKKKMAEACHGITITEI